MIKRINILWKYKINEVFVHQDRSGCECNDKKKQTPIDNDPNHGCMSQYIFIRD